MSTEKQVVHPEVVDQPENWETLNREVQASGRVQNFIEDAIATPDGQTMVRQWVGHPGAVAVMAIFSRAVLLLPIMGACFVASSVSVICGAW